MSVPISPFPSAYLFPPEGAWYQNHWLHPTLGNALPQLMTAPDLVARSRCGAPIKQVEEVADRFVAGFINHPRRREAWGHNYETARKAVEERLRAVNRFDTELFLHLKNLLPGHERPSLYDLSGYGVDFFHLYALDFSLNETCSLKGIQAQESCLAFLYGLLILYSLWGVAGWDHPGIRGASDPIGTNHPHFFARLSPGKHESHAGIDYHLYYKGPQTRNEEKLVWSIGSIHRTEGPALVHVTGGKGLAERTKGPQSLLNRLAKELTGQGGGNIGDWFSRQVLRRLACLNPGRPIFWRPSERNFWFFNRLPNPRSPEDIDAGMGSLVGSLPDQELLALADAEWQKLTDRRVQLRAQETSDFSSFPESSRRELNAVGDILDSPKFREKPSEACKKRNSRAERFGFKRETDWYVLSPSDEAYQRLLQAPASIA